MNEERQLRRGTSYIATPVQYILSVEISSQHTRFPQYTVAHEGDPAEAICLGLFAKLPITVRGKSGSGVVRSGRQQ